MNEKMIEFLKLSKTHNSVLIISDENYFDNTDFDVEIISRNKLNANYYLNFNDYISRRKYPFNYKYKRVIIDQNYVDYIKTFSYLLDDVYNVIIILDKDYIIEKDFDLVDFAFKDNVKNEYIYIEDKLLLTCEKNII